MNSPEFDLEITPRPRVAVVVQRYGQDVNGGAEVHAAMIVKRLSAFCQVEVITTFAKDYKDWSCHYEAGVSEADGITIRRFECEQRDLPQSRVVIKSIKYTWPVLWRRKLFKATGLWIPYGKLNNKDDLGDDWLRCQGPFAPQLKNFIADSESAYDVFIFCTSQYYSTAACLPIVAHKSILVPHLHNETTTFFPVYHRLFNAAERIICNTQSELELMQTIFPSTRLKSQVAGVGVDRMSAVDPLCVDPLCVDTGALPSPNDADYILYLGRVAPGKGCNELFHYFIKYIRTTGSKTKLIIAGGADMKIPEHPQIEFLGYVTESVKNYLISHAKLMVIPSRYESLSLVLLESFAKKVPVLVNEDCKVLKDHIIQSSGGYMFNNYSTFEQQLQQMLDDDSLRARQGLAGYDYICQHYSWEQFDQHYLTAIESILKNNSNGVKHELSTTTEC